MSGQESLIEELVVVLILFVSIFGFFFFAPKKNKKTSELSDLDSKKKDGKEKDTI